MTHLNFYYENDLIMAFEVKGHAGYADSGEDIVCAAISALTQTAVYGLLEYLSIKPNYRIDKTGFLSCSLSQNLSKEDLEKSQIIINTILLGLTSIEKEYARYLKINRRRWSECSI